MTRRNMRLGEQRNLGRVSVIIPALNECETIASVVEFARCSRRVNEVIVVDDGSIDGTPELAEIAGARVITSTMLGKGASMQDGLVAARNETLLFLDGDLRGLRPDLVEAMTEPIFSGTADFVKAKFTRAAGRVTVLTAKPLLSTYFPEISHFEQPLSGIMAARASLLRNLQFENDYGVDVGLFIDAMLARARLREVDIGHIQHDSHPLEVLGEMATQVARTVLDRAAGCGRLRRSYMQEVSERERHKRADLSSVFERFPQSEYLALFDMDGVLLNGRFIVELARRTGRESELSLYLDNHEMPPRERMTRIGKVFAGVQHSELEQAAREVPLMPGAIETVVGLRKAGFRVAIVTDSFHIPSEIVRRRVFADFSFGHLMRFRRGRSTGRMTVCPAMLHEDGCEEHDCCKINVLHHLVERIRIAPERVLAVGDGLNDVCLLKAAGCSVAFQPKSSIVSKAAQNVVHGSLTEVLPIAQAAFGYGEPAAVDGGLFLIAPGSSVFYNNRSNNQQKRN
jgi:glucosyl-3-phosphoglycerate synthase